MRAATAVGATAILILATGMWACAAGAEDAIKPGKWEFSTEGSKIPEPPPGTPLLPSVQSRAMITSACIATPSKPWDLRESPSLTMQHEARPAVRSGID
jgi:hypothetical protein